jgi:uncharacterized membrane protein
LRWNKDAKTNYTTIHDQFNIPLNAEEKCFADFPNTAMYSPISYFPQVAGIFVLRPFDLSPLTLFYGGRIAALLFWIAGIFFSIRLIPIYKWFFALIALLPMSLFINMSFSADVATNLLSFILIAYILKLAYSEKSITGKNTLVTAVLMIGLASAKLVYTPLLLLFFLIPAKKFKSKKAFYMNLIILFTVSAATVLAWSGMMDRLYTPYSQYNPEFRDNATLIKYADMHEQIRFMLTHVWSSLAVPFISMTHSFDMYFRGYIGTFGWLDTKFPMWFIIFSYVIIFIVALSDGNKEIAILPKHKKVFLISLISIGTLVLLSQYLTWECTGAMIIGTIQGRYFIPAIPLFFLLIYNSRFNNTGIIIPAVILFSFFSLAFTVSTLYNRYYVMPDSKPGILMCDAEKITGDNYFETDVPSVRLGNGNTQSSENARSGRYSSKLNVQNQFGFTYRLYNCRKGDSIIVNVWRLGAAGSIIISGGKDDFYISEDKAGVNESAGWENIQIRYRIPADMRNKETLIYLYNNSSDPSYFDDLVVSYSLNK